MKDKFALARRTKEAFQQPVTKVDILRAAAQNVQVYQRGERRQDFLRRWLFRGLDELRRQQANPPAPAPKPELDELV